MPAPSISSHPAPLQTLQLGSEPPQRKQLTSSSTLGSVNWK
jgi:hypothetical protein